MFVFYLPDKGGGVDAVSAAPCRIAAVHGTGDNPPPSGCTPAGEGWVQVRAGVYLIFYLMSCDEGVARSDSVVCGVYRLLLMVCLHRPASLMLIAPPGRIWYRDLPFGW